MGQETWDSLVVLSKAAGNATEIEVRTEEMPSPNGKSPFFHNLLFFTETNQVEAESLTKDQRGLVHNIVKQSFGSSIVSSTITKDDKKFFKFAKYKKNAGNDHRAKWLWPKEYTHFVV